MQPGLSAGTALSAALGSADGAVQLELVTGRWQLRGDT